MVVIVLFTMCGIYPGPAFAATRMGLILSSYIGWNADRATGRNVCIVASYDECQSRTQSGKAGGFNYPYSVAVDARTGNIYVAEIENHRVQKLTANGAFVSMLGWKVNQTRDKSPKASQAEKNVCTAVSNDVCGAGRSGIGAGQLDSPASVVVDQETGDLYVLQIGVDDFRVDKYTQDGRFVWRIGMGVNLVTRGNLCRALEFQRLGVRCGAGVPNVSENPQHGAFKFPNQSGNLLAVDGPKHLLYVGDEYRVQIFGTNGKWKGEIPLVSISALPHSSVVALALSATDELYLVYRVGDMETYSPNEHANIIYEFNPRGELARKYSVRAGHSNAIASIDAMATDRLGRLVVFGVAVGVDSPGRFGLLYNSVTGNLITEFIPPIDNDGAAFNNDNDLYVATAIGHQIAVYTTAVVPTLLTSVIPCEVGPGESSQGVHKCDT
jgi:DNA-binding beta-propeller fold protein YncE